MTQKVNDKNIISLESLPQQLSKIITNEILEGKLQAGEQLIELKLQKTYGVSRSPLREAYRELEKNGLVEIIPRKGTFVKSVTENVLKENFPVRAELEGLAASMTAAHMNKTILSELGKSLKKMNEAVIKNDIKAYHKNHLNFHETYIKSCGNKILINMLKNIRMQAIWFTLARKYFQEDLNKSYEVHEKIYKLMIKNPPNILAVHYAVSKHIYRALEPMLAYIEKNKK